jgi:transcriptional regulator with XRE-family HTH domain
MTGSGVIRRWMATRRVAASRTTRPSWWRRCQDAIAKRAGITKSYLSGIEIGRKSGDVRTLRRLANGLKTTLKVKIDQTVLLAPF